MAARKKSSNEPQQDAGKGESNLGRLSSLKRRISKQGEVRPENKVSPLHQSKTNIPTSKLNSTPSAVATKPLPAPSTTSAPHSELSKNDPEKTTTYDDEEEDMTEEQRLQLDMEHARSVNEELQKTLEAKHVIARAAKRSYNGNRFTPPRS